MCIRDRGRKEALGLFLITQDPQDIDDTVIKQINTKLILNPVSYTHLRAHETVLDLVCRLLLEKKKQENDNKNMYGDRADQKPSVVNIDYQHWKH